MRPHDDHVRARGLTIDGRWEFAPARVRRDSTAGPGRPGDFGAGTWSPWRSGDVSPNRRTAPDIGASQPTTRATWLPATRVPSRSTVPRRTRDRAGAVRHDVTGPDPSSSSSPWDPDATFVCGFDRGDFFRVLDPFSRSSARRRRALPGSGRRSTPLEIATHAGTVSFRVATGAPGPGPASPCPEPAESPFQQAKIMLGSMVLISGHTAKMSRKGVCRSPQLRGLEHVQGSPEHQDGRPGRQSGPQAGRARGEEVRDRADKKLRSTSVPQVARRLAKRLRRFKPGPRSARST